MRSLISLVIVFAGVLLVLDSIVPGILRDRSVNWNTYDPDGKMSGQGQAIWSG